MGRSSRRAARGSGSGRGYNPYRAADGKFKSGAHKKREKETHLRRESIAIKKDMGQLKRRARDASSEERARLKAKFDKLSARRDALRTRASGLTNERREIAMSDPKKAAHLEQRRIARAKRREAKYERDAATTQRLIGEARQRGASQYEIDALEKKYQKQVAMADSWSSRKDERIAKKASKPKHDEQKPDAPKPDARRQRAASKPEPKLTSSEERLVDGWKRNGASEDEAKEIVLRQRLTDERRLERKRVAEEVEDRRSRGEDIDQKSSSSEKFRKRAEKAFAEGRDMDGRDELEKMVEEYGFNFQNREGRAFRVNDALDHDATIAAHHLGSGDIELKPKYMTQLREFAQDPSSHIRYGTGALYNSKSDAMLIAVHEVLHGYGPGRATWDGKVGVILEEYSTEVAARKIMRQQYRASAYGAYDGYINRVTRLIAEHKSITYEEAQQHADRIAFAMKRDPYRPGGGLLDSFVHHLGPGRYSRTNVEQQLMKPGDN